MSNGPETVRSGAAADTVLHGVVREHLETFLAAAAARTDGVGLPRFVGMLRRYLK